MCIPIVWPLWTFNWTTLTTFVGPNVDENVTYSEQQIRDCDRTRLKTFWCKLIHSFQISFMTIYELVFILATFGPQNNQCHHLHFFKNILMLLSIVIRMYYFDHNQWLIDFNAILLIVRNQNVLTIMFNFATLIIYQMCVFCK